MCWVFCCTNPFCVVQIEAVSQPAPVEDQSVSMNETQPVEQTQKEEEEPMEQEEAAPVKQEESPNKVVQVNGNKQKQT